MGREEVLQAILLDDALQLLLHLLGVHATLGHGPTHATSGTSKLAWLATLLAKWLLAGHSTLLPIRLLLSRHATLLSILLLPGHATLLAVWLLLAGHAPLLAIWRLLSRHATLLPVGLLLLAKLL